MYFQYLQSSKLSEFFIELNASTIHFDPHCYIDCPSEKCACCNAKPEEVQIKVQYAGPIPGTGHWSLRSAYNEPLNGSTTLCPSSLRPMFKWSEHSDNFKKIMFRLSRKIRNLLTTGSQSSDCLIEVQKKGRRRRDF